MSDLLYKLAGISRDFAVGDDRVRVIRDVNLAVAPGEFLAIRGRSGAGKSTLLGLLGLMDRPTQGSLEFCGEDLAGLATTQIDALRRRKIGFLFQQDLLIPHLTLHENLSLPLRYNGSFGNLKPLTAETLESVGLGGKASRQPHQLSGGERTRAALARAIIGRPAVLLADEPTGALDSETATAMMGLLRQLHARGTSIIVVTHDDEVAAIADRQIVIKDGRLYV